MQTILVVEDDAAMLRVLTDQLKREGFSTLSAKDGIDGLEVATKMEPDLILLDIIMPRMDGLTMLKQLRAKNTYGKTVPVILLTNLSPDRDDVNQSVTASEPTFYLVQANWTIQHVMEKVKEALTPKA